MRKFKNKFAAAVAAAMTGVMAFGLVATAAPVAAVYAADGAEDGDATESTLDVKIQYDMMILKVKTDDPYFTVDVLKSESDREKASKSYTYANIPTKRPTTGGPNVREGEGDGYVDIDLGFLKLKSENILNVYGSSTDKANGKIVKVAAQPAKEKLTVDATKSTLPEALGKTAAEYQYKTTNGGTWNSLDWFDFTAAKVAGTTLVVRKAASDEEGKAAPAGPEIKVKIPAAAKAPKVTVDYTKGTVKLTDKMQVALLTGKDPIAEDAWKAATKAPTRSDLVKALEIADEKASEPFTIVVRTAASGKKAASMPTVVQIKGTSTLGLVDEEGNEAEGASAIAKVTVDEKATTISAKLGEKGVTFTVAGEGKATFQYDKGSNKWANITDKAVKISATTVKVRVAPEKEDKKTAGSGAFASNSVELTPEVEVAEVTVALGSTSVAQGGTTKATATVKGADGKTMTVEATDIKWSGDTGVTVANDGTVTVDGSASEGKHTIKAEYEGKSGTAELQVTKAAD